LPALVQALPVDGEARQLALRRSLALDSAFRAGALAIVREILRWDPTAMAERDRNANRAAIAAVAEGWSSVKYFLGNGTPVANPPADDDYVELLRLLVATGADANGGPADWRPPLGIVAALPSTPATIAAARLLLGAGADIDAPHAGAQAPLVFAADSGNGDLLRIMLDGRHARQETLDAALVKTHVLTGFSMMSQLLDAGANVNTDQTPGGDPRVLFTPMVDATRLFKLRGEREATRLMVRYRADPNRMSFPGRNESPLMNVVPDPEFTAALLALGADPNYHDAGGTTALIVAVRASEGPAATGRDSARYRSVALLLDRGANAAAEDTSGDSALKGTRADDAAMIALLLDHGGTWRLTDRDLSGYRASGVPIGRYSWAVLEHKDALASATLVRGESPGADDCGLTYYAAERGSTATLETLIRRKTARAAIRDVNGWTPLMAAAANGQLATLRLLLDSHLVSVNEHSPVSKVPPSQLAGTLALGGGPEVGGATVLMVAAGANQAAVIEELIRRGADVNARDATGWTAFDYAERAFCADALAELRRHGAKRGGRS
jgi:uncharacterized protein